MQLPLSYQRGIKKPWTSIPRIDKSHPLAQGLAFYAYDAGGVVIDIVNNDVGAIFSSTTHVVNATSKIGTGLKYGGTNTSDAVTLPLVNSTKVTAFSSAAPFSIACALLGTAGVLGQYYCALGPVTNGNDSIGFAQGASTTIIKMFYNNGTNQIAFNGAFGTNQYISLLSVVSSTTVGTLYYNGQFDQTNGGTCTSALTAQQVNLNTCQAGAAFFGGGILGFIPYFAGWNRVLTASEALVLHTDPYCFLIYPEDEMMAALIGGVGGAKSRKTLSLYGSGAGKRQGQLS